MGYIQGEGRNQGTLFPVILDDFVPADHVCRVIAAFVEKLAMSEFGFERACAAETGRPGYDPRDLLKLYLYGYLNQIRSSRRLEAECRRNVELLVKKATYAVEYHGISSYVHCYSPAVSNFLPSERAPFKVRESSGERHNSSQVTFFILISYLHSCVAYALYGMNLERTQKFVWNRYTIGTGYFWDNTQTPICTIRSSPPPQTRECILRTFTISRVPKKPLSWFVSIED